MYEDKLRQELQKAEESHWLRDAKRRRKWKPFRRIKFKIQARYYIAKRKYFYWL